MSENLSLPDDFVVPDFFEPTFGWKCLRFMLENEELASVYYTKCKWPTRENRPLKAECEPNYLKAETPEHEAPAPQGTHQITQCGFYAHYFLEDLIARERPRLLVDAKGEVYGCFVAAVVEGWGRVEAHQSRSDGWRSEYIKIAALCRPNVKVSEKPKQVDSSLQSIADALGVPYLDTTEAEFYATTLGVCLAPDEG